MIPEPWHFAENWCKGWNRRCNFHYLLLYTFFFFFWKSTYEKSKKGGGRTKKKKRLTLLRKLVFIVTSRSIFFNSFYFPEHVFFILDDCGRKMYFFSFPFSLRRIIVYTYFRIRRGKSIRPSSPTIIFDSFCGMSYFKDVFETEC